MLNLTLHQLSLSLLDPGIIVDIRFTFGPLIAWSLLSIHYKIDNNNNLITCIAQVFIKNDQMRITFVIKAWKKKLFTVRKFTKKNKNVFTSKIKI